MTMTIFGAIRRTAFTLVCVPSLVLFSACELEVSNPGPIQADALDDTKALTSVVNGAGRDLAEALNWTAYTGAAVAREIFPGGSTGSFGITPRQQASSSMMTTIRTGTSRSARAGQPKTRWRAPSASSARQPPIA